MNYFQILRDSFHLFRTNKIIWIFGFLSLFNTSYLNLFSFRSQHPILACLSLPILFAISIINLISICSLYYVIYQAYLNNKVSFSEGWAKGKSKIFQYIGFSVISLPLVFIGAFFMWKVMKESSLSPVLWLFSLLGCTFLSSFLSFGFSAIMIDNIKVLPAAWKSFRMIIYGRNYLRVLVITGSVFVLRLLLVGLVAAILSTGLFGAVLPTPLALDYPTYLKLMATPSIAVANWIFNFVLHPLETIMLIIVYLKFSNEVPPTLVQWENAA